MRRFSSLVVNSFRGFSTRKGVFNKGKVKPFKIFASNDKFPIVFKFLTDPVDVFDEKKSTLSQSLQLLCKEYVNSWRNTKKSKFRKILNAQNCEIIWN